MTKICTSLEQSQKLIELGIDVNTADMSVTNLPLKGEERFDFICMRLPSDTFPSITDGKSEKIPAWSLAALLELTPNDVSLLHLEDVYQAVYDVKPYHITDKYDNPFDAAFEMICWLKENKKL